MKLFCAYFIISEGSFRFNIAYLHLILDIKVTKKERHIKTRLYVSKNLVIQSSSVSILTHSLVVLCFRELEKEKIAQ